MKEKKPHRHRVKKPDTKSICYIISFILSSKWAKLSQGDKTTKIMTISGGGWELPEKGTKRTFWNHGTALYFDQRVLSASVLCILKYVNYASKKQNKTKQGEEVSWKIEQRKYTRMD